MNNAARGGLHLQLDNDNVVKGFRRSNNEAENCGIKVGDRLIGIETTAVRTTAQLDTVLAEHRSYITNLYEDCPLLVSFLYTPTMEDLIEETEEDDEAEQTPEQQAAEKVKEATAQLQRGLDVVQNCIDVGTERRWVVGYTLVLGHANEMLPNLSTVLQSDM